MLDLKQDERARVILTVAEKSFVPDINSLRADAVTREHALADSTCST